MVVHLKSGLKNHSHCMIKISRKTRFNIFLLNCGENANKKCIKNRYKSLSKCFQWNSTHTVVKI